ncbi:MAG: hypothetical protein AAGK03_03570 [Pseudomonadota bacterium]
MPTRQSQAPTSAPVSLAELKAHLRVTSPAEDDLLQSCIDVAIAEIDGAGLLGRAMMTAHYTLTCPPPAGIVPLEIGPAQDITAISYVASDGALRNLVPSDFSLISDGEAAYVDGDWPSDMARRPDALRITYRAGFGDLPGAVPADLRHAVKLLAAHRFEVRDEVVIGTVASAVPNGVERLINLHRVRFFG